jgi:arylformamidase
MQTLWDISPFIDEQSPVFPGDTVYSQTAHFKLNADCPVNVARMTLSPHTGAHADAPLHYANQGPAIGAVDLSPYLGPCRVIHCRGPAGQPDALGPLVLPQHVAHALVNLPPRVLLRTSLVARQDWAPFTAISPEALALLRAHCAVGLLLVGIDTPSVDPADSFALPTHHGLLAHDLRVLENLVLDDVPEGDYELIALPLKLRHADASPVRAVLRSLSPSI